jgi:hypothetical protein
LRAAIAGGTSGAVAGDALWLAIAAAVLLPAAFIALAAALQRAKRDGSLSSY